MCKAGLCGKCEVNNGTWAPDNFPINFRNIYISTRIRNEEDLLGFLCCCCKKYPHCFINSVNFSFASLAELNTLMCNPYRVTSFTPSFCRLDNLKFFTKLWFPADVKEEKLGLMSSNNRSAYSITNILYFKCITYLQTLSKEKQPLLEYLLKC